MSKVWWQYEISQSKIRNCFRKARFSSTLMEEDIDARSSVEECWSELLKVGAIENDRALNGYVRVDDDLVAADYPKEKLD